jgi:hypothetical protein
MFMISSFEDPAGDAMLMQCCTYRDPARRMPSYAQAVLAATEALNGVWQNKCGIMDAAV